MAKYRKKPVVIEAIQFTKNTVSACLKFCEDEASFNSEVPCLHIDTLEGEMIANNDDWIIKGIKGEFYPCKPDIFEATYESV